ncbi:putative membrane protein [Hydromonas duriensis]|uniref:Putative membrane protein n=2 Tax=Hydromonas duriensis TaxID=1527608 RepID=A0A4R6Y8G3_9BURK|nr:putative membrane protein [Hydromonas duriensis]
MNIGALITLLFFIYRCKRVFLKHVDPIRLNIVLTFTFTLSIIWLMKAQLLDYLYLHFIGASLAYLLLGFPMAGLALATVLVFTNLTQQTPIDIWGAQYLLAVLLPLSLSWLLHYCVKALLPKRVFAFIFVHGFFVTATVMVLTVSINLLVLNKINIITLDIGNQVFWVSALLLGWGEAFLTGMMTALITVYRPQWWYRQTLFKDI